MNKKANIFDWIYIMTILLLTGIALFAAYIIIDSADGTGMFADYAEAQAAVTTTKNTLLNFDNFMLFIIIGLSLFVLISSAMVYNHPALFIIGLFFLAIAVTIAAIISNVFWDFSDSSQISATAALYPKIRFLMENLPFYVTFMGLASAVVMYVSYQRQ